MPVPKVKGNVRLVTAVDPNPDLSYLEDESKYKGLSEAEAEEYRREDRGRLETHGDKWWMIGVWAEVDVEVGGVIQRIQSGGLWGVESDSEKEYIGDIAGQEYDALIDILRELGVKKLPPIEDAEWVER